MLLSVSLHKGAAAHATLRRKMPLAAVAERMEAMERKFYKVKELVELLGISKSMVYEYVYRNKIPAKRLGRRILIPEKFVRELLLPEK